VTREERRRILGDALFAQAEQIGRAAAADNPPPSDVIVRLRQILTHPAHPVIAVKQPAA
jgi:hypothetical protein